ncbi:MAG: acetyl-CoA hydrolase/transferase family protein, partial [Gammaproteobacteria bacterium]|nr:acetyl-CoA hydrolase/transferase family protein [Gammaproteobacteria bacterium]
QQGCGEALSLAETFVRQRAAYSGARLFMGSGFSRSFQPEHADHLHFSGIGGIGTLRKLASAGALDPIPCHISSIEGLLRDGIIPSDVVMLQVSPPNERGEYSFGLVNDYVRAAMSKARVVIAEVNRQVPWVHCDRLLTADDITVAVETDRAPLELSAAPFGALEQRIAHHLGDLIGDRSTLQMGIGSVPEAIMSMLADRRELGIHSGMVGDSAMTLMQSGAVTNAHKGIDPGVTVSGVLFGTHQLYRYAERNPQIRLHPTSYTHHIGVLGRLKNFVSINSALEVDLTGQINAEAIGSAHISAIGGQVDYVRAAALSEGGVSIVALPASGKGGNSRIVSRLSGPVTTARSDADVVATEHGVAHLRGRSLRERV